MFFFPPVLIKLPPGLQKKNQQQKLQKLYKDDSSQTSNMFNSVHVSRNIQGNPQTLRLQRRLSGIYNAYFLTTVNCNCKLVFSFILRNY